MVGVGAIVLAPFPYTDLSRNTLRPAVVLANAGGNDWIICQITSSTQSRQHDVAIAPGDLQTGRLTRNSHARPERLITMSAGIFRRTIGQITDAKLAEILSAARSLF